MDEVLNCTLRWMLLHVWPAHTVRCCADHDKMRLLGYLGHTSSMHRSI